MMVNKIYNYGSKEWTDHEVVQLMLKSFMTCNATLATLIRENPRYKKMRSKEVLGKFLNHEMMVKDSKLIDDFAQGNTSTELQAIALEATSKKEEATSKDEQFDAPKLDDEEMTLIIKSFREILRNQKDKDYKPRGKTNCYKCGKSGNFIANCPYGKDDDSEEEKKGKKKFEKMFFNNKKGGETHINKECDSDESTSNNEGVATLAFNKSSLFPQGQLYYYHGKGEQNEGIPKILS
jgi:hypothetical protein